MATKQLTREEIELQINADMDKELMTLLQAKPTDRPKMLMDFETKRIEAINIKVKSIKAETDNRVESEKKATDAFKAHATDVFNEAWAKIKEAATKLEFVTGVSYSVRKDVETLTFEEPTLLLASFKNIKSSAKSDTNGKRGKSLTGTTKDGTSFEYKSAAEAKKALLPGKEDSQMSRAAVVSALKTVGHTVND